ncbi:hypothetical protein PLANPX_1927 [Lacipirellula parvula]|uniref:Uncharacterized protein n=2 Tax=Lacipirellula parvula TaxID=2650471 RepID=A0A5K7X7G1_9BACT|nr:hypothetical protein PLANPX_1927 [Lacipirellula parvula]
MLAATIAEVVPQLVGGRDTVHLARKLMDYLIAYANDWERLPAEEIVNLALPAHLGLVALAREQPWKLRAAIESYVESRCDYEALDGDLDPVIERLVAEAMELA